MKYIPHLNYTNILVIFWYIFVIFVNNSNYSCILYMYHIHPSSNKTHLLTHRYHQLWICNLGHILNIYLSLRSNSLVIYMYCRVKYNLYHINHNHQQNMINIHLSHMIMFMVDRQKVLYMKYIDHQHNYNPISD